MPRALKRKRLTTAELAELEAAIIAEVESEYPQSVRHIFYALCYLANVQKLESGYRRIQRLALNLRKQGRLPYERIADGTRYRIKPNTYGSMEEAINETARFYRQALWRDSDVYVEVWCESDSMAGVLGPVTNRYDISLMSSRGFSSHTFLHQAGVEMTSIGKPTFVFYIGDYDPSGMLIGENIEKHLRNFAPTIDIHFERLLIMPDQIEEFDLPTKPVKHSTHSRRFSGTQTVEAEAMPAGQTRDILEQAILRHIDAREIEVLNVVEDEERQALNVFRLDWMEQHGGLPL